MIISASYRTDIPAFYGSWFENRFRAGFCRVANPYGGKPSVISLRDGVDGYVFWTRHIGPFLPVLTMLGEAGLPFVVQYTVTGYPRALESGVMPAERSVALIHQLAREFGPRSVVWRYDPVVVSELTPSEWHLGNFGTLARHLEGAVDEVVVSFAQIYRKTLRNLATAARLYRFTWSDPALDERRRAIARLAAIARRHGISLRLCTQAELESDGAPAARCIDALRLSDVAGRRLTARTKGNRPGCLCAESRDIGDYDSCPQGCVYCYAVASRTTAKKRLLEHDPLGEFLIPKSGLA